MDTQEKRRRLMEGEQAGRFGASPFRRWAGLELVDVVDEWVVLRASWREEMIGNTQMGVIQGGVQAALIDLAAVYALAAEFGRPAPTLSLRIDYHLPATGQGDLTVRARIIDAGPTVTTVEGYLYNDRDQLLASGRGSFFIGQTQCLTQKEVG